MLRCSSWPGESRLQQAASPCRFSVQSSTGRGLTNADIINDDSKVARVRLEGEVNGVPFVVERMATKK